MFDSLTVNDIKGPHPCPLGHVSRLPPHDEKGLRPPSRELYFSGEERSPSGVLRRDCTCLPSPLSPGSDYPRANYDPVAHELGDTSGLFVFRRCRDVDSMQGSVVLDITPNAVDERCTAIVDIVDQDSISDRKSCQVFAREGPDEHAD